MNDQDIYAAILQYWRAYSVPPTIRRVAEAVPCGQTTVYYHLRKLVKSNMIVLVDRRPVPIEIKQHLELFRPATEKRGSLCVRI